MADRGIRSKGRGGSGPGHGPPAETGRGAVAGVRWPLVALGLLAAYGIGLAGGLAVHQLGWWDGAAWERAVLGLAQRPVPSTVDEALLIIPLFTTNYALVPVVLFVAAWLWRPPGAGGSVLLASLGASILAGGAQLVALFVLDDRVPLALFSILALLGAAAAIWMDRRTGPRESRPLVAMHLLVVQLGSWALNPALKLTLPRPRPELFEPRGQYALPAYPSGHVIAATAVLFTAAYLIHRSGHGRWGYALAAVLLPLIAWSRVYLAVHWPTDVMGGAVVGAVWLLATLAAFRPAHERGAMRSTVP